MTASDPEQIKGSKYFEQVVTPQNAAVKEIPAFVFSFFDPENGAFRTLTHAAIPLHVLPVAATPQPTVAAANAAAGSAQPPAQEIVNIKVRLGSLAMAGPPLWRRPGLLAWQALAPLAWICALLWRRQKDRLANNPRLRRRREVARLVRQGLAELPALAAANDAETFTPPSFACFRSNWANASISPPPAITEAVLEEARAGVWPSRPKRCCGTCSTPATNSATRPNTPRRNWPRSFPRSKPPCTIAKNDPARRRAASAKKLLQGAGCFSSCFWPPPAARRAIRRRPIRPGQQTLRGRPIRAGRRRL